jgi:hypothetical protein
MVVICELVGTIGSVLCMSSTNPFQSRYPQLSERGRLNQLLFKGMQSREMLNAANLNTILVQRGKMKFATKGKCEQVMTFFPD